MIAESEAAEMESLLQSRAAQAAEQYLSAVASSAAGNPLPAEDRLAVCMAVNVTPAQFAADVERQKRRTDAETISGGKSDWQAVLAGAESERDNVASRHAAELAKLREKHAAEMAGVRFKIDDARQALAGVAMAEELLIDTEGVSAICPVPHRPIFGVVVQADEARGFLFVESDQTSPRGHDLYGKYNQLPGVAASPSLIGRQLELEWFSGDAGRKLRAVRVVDDVPSLAG